MTNIKLKGHQRRRISSESSTCEEDRDYKLFGCVRSECLRYINNPNAFLLFTMIYVLANGMANTGVVSINITPLELRFGFSSAQSAAIVTSFSVAFCLLSAVVGYLGGRRNRPRILALGSLVYGLGSAVYALPHFVTPPYHYGEHRAPALCVPLPPSKKCAEFDSTFWLLLLGHTLMGCGVAPLWTLGYAHVNESVSEKKAPIYIGILNTGTFVGPIIGYVFGGLILRDYFVDFDKLSSIALENTDTRWVGAWWVTPLIVTAICWAVAVPLMGYPKTMPGTKKNRQNQISEFQNDDQVDAKSTNDVVSSLRALVRNRTYVMIVMGGVFTQFCIKGVTSFTAKFIENEFYLTAADAAILSGSVLPPAGVVAHIVSSVLVSTTDMRIRTILRFNAVCLFLAVGLCSICFGICGTELVAGITAPYESNSSSVMGSLVSTCNEECACQEEFYVPVCGSDNITYFSGCHAGCSFNSTAGDKQSLGNCSCITSSSQSATMGACPLPVSASAGGCVTVSGFLAVMFIGIFFTMLAVTPMMVALFRVVPESTRSFAIGIFWLLALAIGMIPAPLAFGAIFDSTCLFWQTRQCDGSRASCMMYDNRTLAVGFAVFCMVTQFLGGCFFSTGSFIYKPPKVSNVPENTENSEMKQPANASLEITAK